MAKSKHEVHTEVYAFANDRISLDYNVWINDEAIQGGSVDLTKAEAKELIKDLKRAIEEHDKAFGKSKESK